MIGRTCMKTLTVTTFLALLVAIPLVSRKKSNDEPVLAERDGELSQNSMDRLYDIEDLLT